MKFAAAILAIASVAAAQGNPNLPQILAAMPADLVAAMSYFPTPFIASLMAGSEALPTDVNSMLALAPGIPSKDIPKLSSEYVSFIREVSSLLPTPTGNTDDSKDSSTTAAEDAESSPAPTSDKSSDNTTSDAGSKDADSSDAESSEAGSLDSDSVEQSGEHSSEHSGSSSSKHTTSKSGDKSTKSSSEEENDESSSSGAVGKFTGSVAAAAVIAAVASFF
ncbi:hypothetical protein LPJ73_001239 [Coemansia sp. RSA 2703]|nr:hypothetical protein LPJ73_001239 [Coemansia sp. RSA 2703]KAJ2372938.1 hypothetical protein IW150_003868 [Coemansia sp. RSA 2607]KAJ2394625.1 hypothetical protein GGI05_001953 [Coemansia sp. RSA 2603]